MTTRTQPKAQPKVSARPRGFAALKARGETERLRAISQSGAQRAGDLGTAHRWTSAEARAAGHKSAQTKTHQTKTPRDARAA